MLPIHFDDRAVADLPLPDGDTAHRVTELLLAMVSRRVLPYFRKRKMVDAVRLSRVQEQFQVVRLEDPDHRIRMLSVLEHPAGRWTLHLHERLFDYLAFVLPSDPDQRLGDALPEPRKALAFAELLLRHEVEHVLYPGREEREAVLGDLEFMLDRRDVDPTFFKTLLEALRDPLNGLNGEPYLRLLELSGRGASCDEEIGRLVADTAARSTSLPEGLLASAIPAMGREFKGAVLDECYRGSRSTHVSLARRAAQLNTLLHVLAAQLEVDRGEAAALFHAFREHWGIAALLQELEIPETEVQGRSPSELFDLLAARIAATVQAQRTNVMEGPGEAAPGPRPSPRQPADPPRLSLKDRVEEARSDPRVPRSVLTTIDKNRSSLQGVSGAKYTELVETLLAIPWGRIQPVDVRPEEFVSGLDEGHYGLEKPKQVLADFFTNLIWRYRQFTAERSLNWHHSGSAFLFVGPPGVGKTSLAISVARNLGIPFHKLSLGGMRDEADLRGHGFTYEGSKPGGILQGLIKMNVMNGMIIMDEADKTEKFAIATLLEILDPEQNHLFHDKYTESTVDIDLSNCHFILTANTLDTVPPPVIDRCEVVVLDRYSVEEKVAIAKDYLIPRLRQRHDVGADVISFAAEERDELLRHLVTTYTREAGVRQLERVLRTLFLRLHRTSVLVSGGGPTVITHDLIKRSLDEPLQPRRVNPEDRIGEALALGVDVERGIGSIIPIQATEVELDDSEGRSFTSMVHATGNIEKVMDESRRVAMTGILHCRNELGLGEVHADHPIHLHFMGASSRKDGPSAGGTIALALASLLGGRKVRRDVAMTGEIDTHGRITAVGGLDVKLETAFEAGCRTVLIPHENLTGDQGVERFPAALKDELQVLTFEEWEGVHEPFSYDCQVLQVVAVDHIAQAARVAFVFEAELDRLEESFAAHAQIVGAQLAERPGGHVPCLQLLYVKEPGELHPEAMRTTFCEQCTGCRYLVLPARAEDLRNSLPPVEVAHMQEFDAATGDLVAEIRATLAATADTPCPGSLNVVAPYFVFAKGGALSDELAELGRGNGLRLFATNYAVQGVKIKACKQTLSRVACYLGRLDRRLLDECPFVRVQDGLVLADLSVIPEKYRLDVQRAEAILSRCLERWLHEVDAALAARTRPPTVR